MKRFSIKQKIYTTIILIILISITCHTATVSAQDQRVQPYLYSSYIPLHLGLSIFGSKLYPGLNGDFFYYPSSVVPNFLNPPWTSSIYPNFSRPYWDSSEVPSIQSPLWTSLYSYSPQLLNTSLLGHGFAASSYEGPSVRPPLVEASVYTSPLLSVSAYSPLNRIVWPLTTTYLRTNLF